MLKRLNLTLIFGASITLFWIFLAFFGDFVSPLDPYKNYTVLLPPLSTQPNGNVFILGTDILGRDLWARIVAGTQPVIVWSLSATLCAVIFGTSFGIIAGYYRGFIDQLISFFCNIILSFPVLVLFIVIITQVGSSPYNILIAITFANGPGVYRIIRGEVLAVSTQEFISAAIIRGENNFVVMSREIFPNILAPLVADFCLRFGYTAITIGTLGFLGLGLPPPSPDWGSLVSENRTLAFSHPYLVVFPSMAIVCLVLGLNLLSDGIRSLRK